MQSALDQLVEETFVKRRPQQGMPAEYELTVNGAGRLKVVGEIIESPSAAIGKAIGGVLKGIAVEAMRPNPPSQSQSQSQQPPRQPPRLRRPPARPSMVRDRLLLSDPDRSLCSDALAEQFSLGRIDKPELDRRTNLLYAAKNRGQLREVFEGLPAPVLDKPIKVPGETPRWRVWVYKCAVAVSVPFLLLGASMLASHANVATVLFGVFFLVGGGVWDYFAWSWMSRSRDSS
ncbi:DUF1707 domain-containing protein [Kribbella sp. NPDC004536]|uniref:DUF1707 SHOCT-like domain-containing protein n=1 Tax=Kribbella sp. NPDC004536 TaxID=3364106 RepID=UPI0036D0DE34